jgi:hypothetical protein
MSFVDFNIPTTNDPSLVKVYLHKITSTNEYLFLETTTVNDFKVDEHTFSINNYFSALFVASIKPLTIQTAINFSITYSGKVKIWLDNQLVFEKSSLVEKVDTFEYTFLGYNDYNIVVLFQVLEQVPILSILNNSKESQPFQVQIGKKSYDPAYINSIINPLGIPLSIDGKVDFTDTITSNNCSTKQLEATIITCETINNLKLIQDTYGNHSISIPGELQLLGSTFTTTGITANNLNLSNNLNISGDLYVKGKFKYDSIQVGIPDTFVDGIFEYPRKGKMIIVGNVSDAINFPGITLYNQHDSNPLFQVTSKGHDNTSISFGDPNAVISKVSGHFLLCDALDIDLVSHTAIFQVPVVFTKSVSLPSTLQVGEWMLSTTVDKLFLSSQTSIDKVGNITTDNIICQTFSSIGLLCTRDKIQVVKPMMLEETFSSKNAKDGIDTKEHGQLDSSISTMGGIYSGKNIFTNKGLFTKLVKLQGKNPKIVFNTIDSTSPPIIGGSSIGARLVLSESKQPNMTSTAIGIDSNSLWYSSAFATSDYTQDWYFGKTRVMSLTGEGSLYLKGTKSDFIISGLDQDIVFKSESGKFLNLILDDWKIATTNSELIISVLDTDLIHFGSDILCIKKQLRVDDIESKNIGAQRILVGGQIIIDYSGIKSTNNNMYLDYLKSELTVDSIKGNELFVQANIVTIGSTIKIDTSGLKVTGKVVAKELLCEMLTLKNLSCNQTVGHEADYDNLLINNITSKSSEFLVTSNSTVFSGCLTAKDMTVGNFECNNINIKSGIQYKNTVETCLVNNEQVYDKWIFLGQLNSTPGSNGILENGQVYIDMYNSRDTVQEDNVRNVRFMAYILQGNIHAQHDVFGCTQLSPSSQATCSNIFVYKSIYGDYNVYILNKCNSQTDITIKSNTLVCTIDSGTDLIPNNIDSTWLLEYNTNKTSTMEIMTGKIVSEQLQVNKSSIFNNDIQIQQAIYSEDKFEFNLGDFGSFKTAFTLDSDNAFFSGNLIAQTPSSIGTQEIPWTSLFVNTATFTSVTSDSLVTNTLKVVDISGTSINILGSTQLSETFIKSLTIGTDSNFQGKVNVYGKALFKNDTDIIRLHILGSLTTHSIVSKLKPLYINCNNVQVGNDLFIKNTGIEIDKIKVIFSTQDAGIEFSPNESPLLMLSTDDTVTIGKKIDSNYPFSPVSHLVVNGTLDIAKASTFGGNMDVSGKVTSDKLLTGNLELVCGTSNIELKNDQGTLILSKVSIDLLGNVNCNSVNCLTDSIITGNLKVLNVSAASIIAVGQVTATKFNLSDNASFFCENEIFNINTRDQVFTFGNDGTFTTPSISVSEIKVLSGLTTSLCQIFKSLIFSNTTSYFTTLAINSFDESFNISNTGGDINLIAAGTKGVKISGMTGNVTMTGQLTIGSGLDLFTTGELDITSAALCIKGGLSVGGYTSTKGLLLRNVEIISSPTSSYTLTLPKELPMIKSTLVSTPQGQLLWEPIQDVKKDVVISQFPSNISTESIKALVVDANTITSQHATVQSLTSGTITCTRVSILDSIGFLEPSTTSKLLVGASKTKIMNINIVFNNVFPDNNYKIIGNIVSYINDPTVIICMFKNLTSSGCTATLVNILEDKGWEDLTICLHYTVTPN